MSWHFGFTGARMLRQNNAEGACRRHMLPTRYLPKKSKCCMTTFTTKDATTSHVSSKYRFHQSILLKNRNVAWRILQLRMQLPHLFLLSTDSINQSCSKRHTVTTNVRSRKIPEERSLQRFPGCANISADGEPLQKPLHIAEKSRNKILWTDFSLKLIVLIPIYDRVSTKLITGSHRIVTKNAVRRWTAHACRDKSYLGKGVWKGSPSAWTTSKNVVLSDHMPPDMPR